MKTCEKCENGKYTAWDGKIETCRHCAGSGLFEEPNIDKILSDITTSRGGNFRLKASAPNKTAWSENTSVVHPSYWRSYYVWRLARFHGGVDVTMPMMAETMVGGDPYRKDLEEMAESLARKFFGSDMAAASVWKNVLG